MAAIGLLLNPEEVSGDRVLLLIATGGALTCLGIGCMGWKLAKVVFRFQELFPKWAVHSEVG